MSITKQEFERMSPDEKASVLLAQINSKRITGGEFVDRLKQVYGEKKVEDTIFDTANTDGVTPDPMVQLLVALSRKRTGGIDFSEN